MSISIIWVVYNVQSTEKKITVFNVGKSFCKIIICEPKAEYNIV